MSASAPTPPVYGSLLEQKAAERRKFLTQQQNEAASFKEVLQVPCQAHGAQPGSPCWRLGDSSRGICGPRISRAIGQWHRQKVEALERQAQKKIRDEEQRRTIEVGRRRRLRDGAVPRVTTAPESSTS